MMTKQQHIAYWLKSSEEDEITMQSLFKDGRYTHCLFFGHLYLEKICKALWVKNNEGNTPPYIHNLAKIIEGINTGLFDIDIAFLVELNKYQLSGRYPEYTFSLQKQTNKEIASNYINKIKSIYKCLQKQL